MKSLDQDSLLMTGSWTSSWSTMEVVRVVVGEARREGGWASSWALPLLLGKGDLLSVGDAGAVLFFVGFASGLLFAGWDVRSSELPRDACTPSPLRVPSVADAVGILALKKPFRLCCPFPADTPVAAVETDLVRLKERLVDVSPKDRFLLVLFAGLAGGTGEAGFEEDCNGRVVSGATKVATCGSTASCDTAEGTAGTLGKDLSPPCGKVDDWVLCAVGREGLRENISLIFLRRSNSGTSLPDSGSKSFVEYSRNLLPSLNMPAGFIMSRT